MYAARWLGKLTVLFAITSCGCRAAVDDNKKPSLPELRGASSYTPYDAFSMLWSRRETGNTMVWVSSGAEAGQQLVSAASSDRRPDWILCTQGVVAGLAAKGEDVVIIASTYVSDNVLLPVYRKPRRRLVGAKSLYIPRSSVEFAFDRLLAREGVSRDEVQLLDVESVGFTTIATLLTKLNGDKDALDFAILVEPFITNMMQEHPDEFEIGDGGLYEMHYCVVVRRDDLASRHEQFMDLLRAFDEIDDQLNGYRDDDEFYAQVWGRNRNGQPERLPRLLTYDRRPARLELRVHDLQERLEEELDYLVRKYPGLLTMPKNVKGLVDASLLEAVNPAKVVK